MTETVQDFKKEFRELLEKHQVTLDIQIQTSTWDGEAKVDLVNVKIVNKDTYKELSELEEFEQNNIF